MLNTFEVHQRQTSTPSFAENAIFSLEPSFVREVKKKAMPARLLLLLPCLFRVQCSDDAKRGLAAGRYCSTGMVWICGLSLSQPAFWLKGHRGNIGSVGLRSRWCCQTQSVWLLALKWRLVSNFVPLGVGISLNTISRWIDCFIVVVDDGDQIHRRGWINREGNGLHRLSFWITNQWSLTMGEREDNVYKAKLAEQAERYDGKKSKTLLFPRCLSKPSMTSFLAFLLQKW